MTEAPSSGSVSRFVVLDFYRYVAAASVVLFHVANANPDSRIPAAGSYGLFVDMFFILSGFVIAYTYKTKIQSGTSYYNFMVKRLARVYPLHLLVLVALFCVDLASGGFSVGMSSRREFVVNALLLQTWGFSADLAFNTPAWSISAELACYLAFPLLVTAIARLPLWAVFTLVAAGYVIGHHGHLPIWSNPKSQMLGATFDYGLIRGLVGFANGIALCRLFTVLPSRQAYLALGVGAMVLGIVCMNVFAKGDLIILLMAIATLATALGEAAWPGRGGLAPILEWFGNTSYAIYMLHWPVVVLIVTPFLKSRPEMSEAQVSLVLLATVVGLTLAGRFTFVRIEVPARQWVTRTFSVFIPKQSSAAVS